MKNTYTRRVASIAALTLIGVPGLTHAQGSEETIIVTASRLPETQLESSSTVEVIEAEERENRQQIRLQDALQLASGVISTSTAGQEGQTATLLIRGLATRYNQVLVDGVRISDSVNGGTHGNILGNLTLGGTEKIEIAKGAQGVIHGNAAIGGVLGVYDTFRQGEPTLSFSQEFGSYELSNSRVSSSGSLENLSYYLNVSKSSQEPDYESAFPYKLDNSQASFGLQYILNDTNTIRFTAREGEAELEGSDGTLFGDDYKLFSLQLLTDNNDTYKNSIILGYYNQDYYYGSDYETNFDKWSLTFDNSISVSDEFTLKAGIDLGWNNYQRGFDVKQEWRTQAAYLGANIEIGATTLSLSARVEDNSDYGTMPSAEFAVNHAIKEADTNLFFKVSNAFRAPSYLETDFVLGDPRYGVPDQLANNSLEEENITSLELGMTKSFNDNHEFSLSGYAHFLDNAMQTIFNGVANQVQNVSGISEVFGLEASIKGSLFENLYYLVSWNHSIKNDLVDISDNTLNADIHYDADKWLVGIGVSQRSEATYNRGSQLDAHIITRVYGEYDVTEHLTLQARVENVFDEQYRLDSKIQGRGLGVYAGATLKF